MENGPYIIYFTTSKNVIKTQQKIIKDNYKGKYKKY